MAVVEAVPAFTEPEAARRAGNLARNLEIVLPAAVLVLIAAACFLGPLVLGRLFDTWGRRTMIAATYAISGLLLGLTAILFVAGLLDAATQTLVTKADLYAGGDQFETQRRVVWAKAFAPIAGSFTSLQRAPGVSPVDSAGTAGFSTSGRAVVAHLVARTANDADIVMAFIAAEGLQ